MAKFKCAVFDVDGTLLDTSEGLIAAVRYTIQHFGLPELDEETIKTFIGPPIQNSFKKTYGFDEDKIKEMAAVFRNQYKDVDLLKARPYEDIYNVLAKLKEENVEIAIATYKRQDYASRILEHFGFDKYTTHIFGSDFEGKLKKQDIIKLALKDAGVEDPSEAVMIGDSDNDAIGAKEIGTAFIGVTYGFGFKSEEDVNEFDNVGSADEPMEIIKSILGGNKNEN